MRKEAVFATGPFRGLVKRGDEIMETMRWKDGVLELLDQTKLPGETSYITCRDYRDVAAAIKVLAVRGAPAIGAAAAYALVLGASGKFASRGKFEKHIKGVARELAATRPTAVNLQWALDRMIARLNNSQEQDPVKLRQILLEEANAIFNEDVAGNMAMGKYGQELIPHNARILTHCNAGALATAGYGTAIGVIRAAHEAGKKVSVYADETRPLLQGARLTAWELKQEGIPVTVITDNMSGYLMRRGMVDLVIVGADRIAANGDVANKIGTYSVAVLAKYHGIPFYVAAPLSTVDFSLSSGEEIPIEERGEEEVSFFAGVRVTPTGAKVWNPAFDVTPHDLVEAIITERGLARKPFERSLRKLAGGRMN